MILIRCYFLVSKNWLKKITIFRNAMELVTLYVSSRRLTAKISNVLMFGLQLDGQIGADQNLEKFSVAGIILNYTLFFTFSRSSVIGLEG